MYSFRHGEINPDAFQQDEVWYDAKGECHVISEMPYSYARNTIAFLHRKCHRMRPSGTPLMRALQTRMRVAREQAH